METIAAADAVRAGDIGELRRLLAAEPGLATGRLPEGRGGPRTLLHVATDWPGHVPRAADAVRVLVEHGADVDVRMAGGTGETPLHWAASADDVAALDALLDAGAAIDLDGAIIGGGTALDNAVAFGQWNVARRLVERGARLSLRSAAALGLIDVVRAGSATASAADLTNALWYAAHGGEREVAAYLLAVGADPTWVGWDDLTPAGAARRSGATELAEMLEG